MRGICTFCLRRTKKYCSSVQATHAVLLSFTRKTCKFRLYRIVFGKLYLKSNLSCLATVFDTGYIFEIFMCPDGNAPYFIILMSRFCLSRGECCRSQNSLALYCRYRWLSFEVFVNRWISFEFLIQAWHSIMTPGQDFIEPDTVLKCGALQIKRPAFPPYK
jgi:hypothetical protein